MEARLDSEHRLTMHHVSQGRLRLKPGGREVEYTLCGLQIPGGARPASDEAPVCEPCEDLDA